MALLSPTAAKIEWPTLALVVAVYASFGLVTWFHAEIPWWALFVLGGVIVTLQGSLQHEIVHGHPTPWRHFNEALVFPCLWLWLPFGVYRDSHLVHHRDENLTHYDLDPESNYICPVKWEALPAPVRAFHWARSTFLGRFILGPPWAVYRTFKGAIGKFSKGDVSQLGDWIKCAAGVALTLGWVIGVCQMDFWTYLMCFAYTGTSITMVRSYLEHQARPGVAQRICVVDRAPVMSVLFLNNNYHSVHHAQPLLAWYKIPALYREKRAEFLKANGNYRYDNYLQIALKYLLSPKERPNHPGFKGERATRIPSPSEQAA